MNRDHRLITEMSLGQIYQELEAWRTRFSQHYFEPSNNEIELIEENGPFKFTTPLESA